MVGNFREVFIFAFFASQEPFAKIKVAQYSLSAKVTKNANLGYNHDRGLS